MAIIDSVKEAREKAAKRKFKQSIDLCIALRSLDLNKPENKINMDVHLPAGRGKDIKTCVITDITSTEGLGVHTITKNQLNTLDKKAVKKLAKEYDYFLGEVSLMAVVGKIMGQVLGPRGKMPKPFPPKANIAGMIQSAKTNVPIRVTKVPTIQVSVGHEEMKDEEIEENIKSVLTAVEKKLPKGRQQMANAYVKLTMGPAIKLKL